MYLLVGFEDTPARMRGAHPLPHAPRGLLQTPNYKPGILNRTPNPKLRTQHPNLPEPVNPQICINLVHQPLNRSPNP